ncbi:nuclear transport factor 2 family protein [Gracilimonas halophila]|uniref:Nuclear transport factor 2 family protein n=1 Tax=Gracilimonas halophila TaxID=1834464 RepID=A0ABW5JKM5_9BACT
MKTKLLALLLILIPILGCAQQENEKQVLTDLLNEFLEGASYSDPEIHDRFWADDLIYTGSAGNRTTKPEMMSGMTEPANYDVEPEVKYHGEDVQNNLFGNTAVVAFKLVAVDQSSAEERMEYYNTGTFVKRNGEWRAVAWQATRIPG